MSEIAHPPIDINLMSAYSLEQNFAQSAALLLLDNCVKFDDIIENTLVSAMLTQRVDMESSNSGQVVSLRLRSIPVLQVISPDLRFQPSSDYLVVALEQATYSTDNDDFGADEELDWQPYVMAVMDNESPENTQVLNAKTGLSLNMIDLHMARLLLNKLSDEFSDIRCNETDLTNILGVTYRPVPRSTDYVEFDVDEYIDTAPCENACVNDHYSCSHTPYSLN